MIRLFTYGSHGALAGLLRRSVRTFPRPRTRKAVKGERKSRKVWLQQQSPGKNLWFPSRNESALKWIEIVIAHLENKEKKANISERKGLRNIHVIWVERT